MKDKMLWIIFIVVIVGIFIYSLFFTRPTYKITFDSSGGTVVDSQDVKRNDQVSKPEDPVRDGYIFKEWQVDGVTYDFATPVTDNITITAVWEEVAKYTITFNSNGGSKVNSQVVEIGNKVTKPKNPTRKGYKFVEWQVGGKKYNFDNKVTKNITLKAKWKKS